jgi:hypothetical protein
MTAKKRLTPRGVQRMRDREASVGMDPEDDAAQWLAEHDPPAPPATPKSAKKSVTLHRFKRRRDHARRYGAAVANARAVESGLLAAEA